MTSTDGERSRFQRKPRRQPEFLAKVFVQTRNGGFWRTIGAAWSFKDGSPGWAISLHSMPFHWDGRVTLFVPEPTEEVPEHDPDTGEVNEPAPAATRRRKRNEEVPA